MAAALRTTGRCLNDFPRPRPDGDRMDAGFDGGLLLFFPR
jgi:hypothetical protein